MPRALVSLGGNLGDVRATFRDAIESLRRHPHIQAVHASRTFSTPPVGDDAGDPFLNAAAELTTSLEPLPLLELLQATEQQLGRVRTLHWGPRTLDLDLLTFDDLNIYHPRLKLPHPGCWYRRFVLDPLVEIAADVVHPEKEATFFRLRERLLVRPLQVSIAGGEPSARGSLVAMLVNQFDTVECYSWDPSHRSPHPDSAMSHEADWLPGLLLWLGPNATATAFSDLPIIPRLDLTAFPEMPHVAARYAIEAALGEPHPET
jgi:2-amino-4-hydroxy-6-hydroxymethyldihydropteridine diphosphokinase